MREKIYFDEYLPFVEDLMELSRTYRKKLDEALFEFGKFLKGNKDNLSSLLRKVDKIKVEKKGYTLFLLV